MNFELNGFIYILKPKYINYASYYKLGIGYIYYANDTEYNTKEIVMESFLIRNIYFGIEKLKEILSIFNKGNGIYRCDLNWMKLSCLYVQRRINMDDNIMDVELPFIFNL